MTDDDQVDALLADVARFLVKSDASSDLLQDTPLKTDPDSLLVSSHQLVAETEALLSSEADNNSLLGVNSAQTVSNVTAEKRRAIRNAQAAQRRLRYRQKIKNEKETLQQQEIQLSQELSKLQRARMDGKNDQVDRMTLSVWKAIATRQKERRVDAEAQQRQLRAAVVGRARLIHQMNALLQRPDSQVHVESCGDRSDSGEQHAGSALLRTFVGELDELYVQTDQIMEEMDFSLATSRLGSRYFY